MRCLAIGDIHGCSNALMTLVSAVPIRPDDLVITLGDYINRGPNSYAVLDWLIARYQTGKLVPLRGNHELMMLAARDNESDLRRFLEVGGDATLSSYSHLDEAGSLGDVPETHWRFLEDDTRSFHQTQNHFFVHANAYADIPLEEQPEFMLYWESFDDPAPHSSGKVMVCGHTPQRSGWPKSVGHAVCIDTGAYRGGWLTCLDFESGKFWQANETGESRAGWLDEL